MEDKANIIIYNTDDGKTSVALYAHEGNIWLNQQQMAELFATSKQTISHHIVNILKDRELDENSVVKYLLTTAADGKSYKVVFYSLEMVISSAECEAYVNNVYERFNNARKRQEALDADKEDMHYLDDLENSVKDESK